MSYQLSVIIIGKNTEKILARSIDSVIAAVNKAGQLIEAFEVLYVDSNSTDSSLQIAEGYAEVRTVAITSSTFYSASLGRHLGLQHARYDNLLFLDGDMTLSPDWFTETEEAYARHRAIVGQWNERELSMEGELNREIANYNGIEQEEVLIKPCGFLQINRKLIAGGQSFHPLIVNNEEKDFYAQFYGEGKIVGLPIKAFDHNNFKRKTSSKWAAFLSLNGKTGYLTSFYYAIKEGYVADYFRIQYDKFLNVLVLLCLIVALLTWNVLWGVPALLLLVFPLGKLKSRLADLFFFPYKLYATVRLLSQEHAATYQVDGKTQEADLK
ncbi:glycosyltransferase family A protein [Neolewinella agarilytica]|uniref:Glycosyltransferase involved in cell wall bisynthesis n=1 Tax=Neolewinella agarilytica TaxID=478744 RepID=A0A1H9DYM4_9BACT|nr:glycosyltransferase family 2 protein [Neolewinella agarilytica]SEQ18564.1 Glycosyltransferase involved in cell wall bisynthesis [Neolewinella agarilytica]